MAESLRIFIRFYFILYSIWSLACVCIGIFPRKLRYERVQRLILYLVAGTIEKARYFPVLCIPRISHGVCIKSRRGETSSLEHFSENLKKRWRCCKTSRRQRKDLMFSVDIITFYSSQPSRDWFFTTQSCHKILFSHDWIDRCSDSHRSKNAQNPCIIGILFRTSS